ncbi:MAG TPA: DUF2207 domain-containing protein, partial [Armatimonadetes bacterium]|nr:DUF2207 domain-containing protein [Armatimonadota bacterium]
HCKLIVTLLTASICLSINWHHGYAWQINDFTVDIRVHSDSHITVTERITVDFGYERRHGIYRVIPYKYQRSADMLLGKGGMRLSYNLRIKVRSVTDALGNGRPYRVRRWGGNINIRIGHPKRYVSGVQVYVITYDVWRALNKFPDHVELYWNATGNEWSAYIYSATARVRLPLAVNPLNTQTVAATFYTGPYGSRTRLGTMHRTSEYIVFKTSNLPPQSGLTIVVGFPANAVVFPSRARELLWMLQDNWRWLMPFMLPLIALGMMLTLWYAYGRDPLRHLPIMVQYEPPEGLSPAEVGTLIDESADVSDIVATVVDLAVRGYLKIRELPSAKFLFFTERDYEFVLLKDYERAFARWRAWKGVKRKRSDTTESKNEGNSSDEWDMLAEHEYLFLHGMFGASVD